MSYDRSLERVDRLHEWSKPITDSVNELCMGRPVDVALQALGFAAADAVAREHPFSEETVRLFGDLAQADMERMVAERPTRVQLLACAQIMGLKITFISALLNEEV